MMMKKEWIIGTIAPFFIFALFHFASAETIVLKSGQTIEGKITEKTGQYIKIDVSGVAVPYFLDEIKSVDGGAVVSSGYSGVEIIGSGRGAIRIPLLEGWERKETSEEGSISEGAMLTGAMLTRENPFVVLSININDFGDSRGFSLGSLRRSLEDKYKDFKANFFNGKLFGVPAFVVEAESGNKVKEYHFIRDRKHYAITFACKPDIFDEQLKYIEGAIKSIEFVD